MLKLDQIHHRVTENTEFVFLYPIPLKADLGKKLIPSGIFKW